jgi:hypothetical protein
LPEEIEINRIIPVEVLSCGIFRRVNIHIALRAEVIAQNGTEKGQFFDVVFFAKSTNLSRSTRMFFMVSCLPFKRIIEEWLVSCQEIWGILTQPITAVPPI